MPHIFSAALAFGLERSQPEKKPLLAEEAFAAGDGEGDHDPVADLQLAVAFADLDHLAHGFMAQDVALFHARHDPVEEVEVGAADGAGRDLDDGVAIVLDLGVGNALAADVVFAVPG